MISILIFILIKLYGREKISIQVNNLKQMLFKRSYIFFVIQITLLMLSVFHLLSQEINFKVVQNNSNIGWIQLKKTDSGSYSSIELHSEIKKRVVFLVSVIEKQQVTFNDGLMLKSYVYRRVNDNIKMNKHK